MTRSDDRADPQADAGGDAGAAHAADASATQSDTDDPRVSTWEQRFFWPVVLSAVASVPAMFLTMVEGSLALAGEAILYLSMAVFAAETVVLLVLARDKRRWLREHWSIVAVTALTIPAVLLLFGPAQVLRLLTHLGRLVRTVGALRIIRVGRIFKAGKILYNRTGFSGPVRTGIAFGLTGLAAVFVALVLSDSTADSRLLLERVFGDAWIVAVVVAGLILAAATFVVARRRDTSGEDGAQLASTDDRPGAETRHAPDRSPPRHDG